MTPTSTDFFADLERQLVDAAAERPRRLRRARQRAAAVTLATLAVLAGGTAGIVALATGPHTSHRSAPAAPSPKPPAVSLSGVRVTVLDASNRPGGGQAVLSELAAAGARVLAVRPAPALKNATNDVRATQVFFRPGHQAQAIDVGALLRQRYDSVPPPVSAMPEAMARTTRGDVAVIVGPDHFMRIPAAADIHVAVLNGTPTPGLARGVANAAVAHGFSVGAVTNAPRQDVTRTRVLFASGHRHDAAVVASALGVGKGGLRPLDAATAPVAGRDAEVVVLVGADLVPGQALQGITATVLNATSSPGLASRVRNRLVQGGATVPDVASGLGRHETRTQVLALRGHRREAQRVAATLGLDDTAVALAPAHIAATFGGHGITVFVVAGTDIAP